MTKKKHKAQAGVHIPQTRDEAAAKIHELGNLQRELARLGANMNDELAAITARCQPAIDGIVGNIKLLGAGIQVWCEANRAEITNDNKVKTANLVTGTVAWRTRPPSVSLTKVDSVLSTLRLLKLQQFIATKEDVDRSAILAAYNAAKNAPTDDPNRAALLAAAAPINMVSGIRIVTGVEDFVIQPFEQEVGA